MKKIKRYKIIAQAGSKMEVRFGGVTYLGTHAGNTPDGIIFRKPDGQEIVLVVKGA